MPDPPGFVVKNGCQMRGRIATGILIAFLIALNLWVLANAPRRVGFHSAISWLNGSGNH